MLIVDNLRKAYNGVVAVNNISFRVEAGERFVLLGRSGCGKTTCLKMLNRMIAPDSGRVIWHGQDVATMREVQLRRRIGYVMQEAGLFPHYTVAENIGVVPRLLGHPAGQIRKRVGYLMELLRLPQLLQGKYPNTLSGGQQQRVGIARALAADPELILMDEPFGALDPLTRFEVQEEFLNLEALAGKTIVMVTHDVFEAAKMGDQICLLDQGELMQGGKMLDLLTKPKKPFVASFFESQRYQLLLSLTQLATLAAKTQALQAGNHEKVWTMLPQQSLMQLLVQSGEQDAAVCEISGKQYKVTALMESFHRFIVSKRS